MCYDVLLENIFKVIIQGSYRGRQITVKQIEIEIDMLMEKDLAILA